MNGLVRSQILLLCAALTISAGCISSESLVATTQVRASYSGCISATPLDTTRVKITFEFPDDASKVKIFRDGGYLVATFNQRNVTSYIDTGLIEGQIYSYTCEGVFDGAPMMGTRILQVSPVTSNPPDFDGVLTATLDGGRQVRLTWNPATGIPAEYYQLFAVPVSPFAAMTELEMDTLGPETTVPSGTNSAIIKDLGDDLTYAFGVRACSVANICDSNTEFKKVAISDQGLPRTLGATSAIVSNAQILITVPWTHRDGGIARRVVSRSNENGTVLTTLKNFDVDKPWNPQTTLALNLGASDENKWYYFVVRDADLANPTQTTANTQVVKVFTGDDLVRPLSIGVPAVKNPQELIPAQLGLINETTLYVQWTARAAQYGYQGIQSAPANDADPNGPNEYWIYAIPSSEGDACLDAIFPYKTVPASNFRNGDPVSEAITDLFPKTTYSICVKSVDAAGNVSNQIALLPQTDAVIKKTLDKTAPVFDGIQSLSWNPTNGDNGKLEIRWNVAEASSDIEDYKITVWTEGTVAPYTKSAKMTKKFKRNLYPTGYDLERADPILTFDERQLVFVKVDACDIGNAGAEIDANCTDLDVSKVVELRGLTPPKNFSGIKSAVSTAAEGEGVVKVGWDIPPVADQPNYAGIVIFEVDNPGLPTPTITEIKRCPCPANNCPAAFTAVPPFNSCKVNNLKPFQQIYLHARAYDVDGNIGYLNPAISYKDADAYDATPPEFIPATNPSYSDGAVHLTWSEAHDSQDLNNPYFTTEGHDPIIYKVFRKTKTGEASNNFTSDEIANPPAGYLIASSVGPGTSFNDVAPSIAQSTTYYYLVCAFDGFAQLGLAPTFRCDTQGKEIATRDITPPEIRALTITGGTNSPEQILSNTGVFRDLGTAKTWSIDLSVWDNGPAKNVSVMVYRKIAGTKNLADFPDPSTSASYTAIAPPLDNTNSNVTLTKTYTESASADAALDGVERYINYVFIANDTDNPSKQVYPPNIFRASVWVHNQVPTTPSITHLNDGAGNLTPIEYGGKVSAMTQSFRGSCDPTANIVTGTALNAGVTAISGTCSGSGQLDVTVTFSSNVAAPEFKVTTANIYGNSSFVKFKVVNGFVCPEGYIAVKKNTAYVTSDFCVAKFEMKAVLTHPETGPAVLANAGSGAAAYNESYYAASRSDGTPWTNISRPEAETRCAALNANLGTNGTYSLISNSQWQTLARDIESVSGNYSADVRSTWEPIPRLPQGFSGADPSATAQTDGLLLASGIGMAAKSATTNTDLSDPFAGTSRGSAQKRTYTLSNNEVIWDFSGNVSEWVSSIVESQTIDGSLILPSLEAAGTSVQFTSTEYFSITDPNWVAYNDANLNNFGPSRSMMNTYCTYFRYSCSQYFSYYTGKGYLSGGNGAAIHRGGAWVSTDPYYQGPVAGIYYINLNNDVSTRNTSIGFRCTYIPNP